MYVVFSHNVFLGRLNCFEIMAKNYTIFLIFYSFHSYWHLLFQTNIIMSYLNIEYILKCILMFHINFKKQKK